MNKTNVVEHKDIDIVFIKHDKNNNLYIEIAGSNFDLIKLLNAPLDM